jgi:hypothetical protein
MQQQASSQAHGTFLPVFFLKTLPSGCNFVIEHGAVFG